MKTIEQHLQDLFVGKRVLITYFVDKKEYNKVGVIEAYWIEREEFEQDRYCINLKNYEYLLEIRPCIMGEGIEILP